MGKKYIQGKDGKFQGSVSDGLNLPTSLSIPSHAPQKPSSAPEPSTSGHLAAKTPQALTAASDEEVQRWSESTGGVSMFMDNRIPNLSGSVEEQVDGSFRASIDAQYLDRYPTTVERSFSDPYTAEKWVEKELHDRTAAIYEFEQAWAHSPEEATRETNALLKQSPTWVEQTHDDFGPRTGWMRGTYRGATVQRLGPSGYLVTVHDYRSSLDEEGTAYLHRHLPDFDTAWGLARFLCARKASG